MKQTTLINKEEFYYPEEDDKIIEIKNLNAVYGINDDDVHDNGEVKIFVDGKVDKITLSEFKEFTYVLVSLHIKDTEESEIRKVIGFVEYENEPVENCNTIEWDDARSGWILDFALFNETLMYDDILPSKMIRSLKMTRI